MDEEAIVCGFTPLEKYKKRSVGFLKKYGIDFIIYKKEKKSCNMHFKSDVGSSPPPFKCVVMLTPALGCFEKDMNKIINYAKLIKELPINEQSARIKKLVWERIIYKEKEEIEKLIFSNNTEIELSRKQIKNEKDIKKKLIMILMWGYPTGGRGNNIQNVLSKLEKLVNIFSEYKNKNLVQEDFLKLVSLFKGIEGLGISTWTKFLYFFEISIESKQCEIFDLKIVESLNKKQFVELGNKNWIQDTNNYLEYINLLDEVSNKINVKPDQVELFLFYFNLYYKF